MRFKISLGKCLIAAFVLAAAWFYSRWTHYLEDFYRQQIPAEVEVSDLVYADSGIRGSCGAAIFELAPRAKAQLGRVGIGVLTGPIPKHVPGTGPGISAEWKETPYRYHDNESPGDGFWALTLSCTWLGKGKRDAINNALSKPGSFFRRHKEGVILVVPSAAIVAYLFFD